MLVLPVESLVVEVDVMSRQTGITGEKGHIFLSDRWIALQVLQKFPEAVFLVLLMESLLVEDDVMSIQDGIKDGKGHKF